MMEIDTPATIFDMAELGGARSPLEWSVVKEMWRGGESFAVRIDGALVALCGLYPIEGGAEAWFCVRPAAAGHMLAIVRAIRLTLACRAYPEIVVICTSPAGSRIAAACGFSRFGTSDYGEIWHAGFAGQQQGQGSGPPAGGAAAAAHVGGAGTPAG